MRQGENDEVAIDLLPKEKVNIKEEVGLDTLASRERRIRDDTHDLRPYLVTPPAHRLSYCGRLTPPPLPRSRSAYQDHASAGGPVVFGHVSARYDLEAEGAYRSASDHMEPNAW